MRLNHEIVRSTLTNKNFKIAIKKRYKPQIKDRLIAINNLHKIADKYSYVWDSVIQIMTNFIKINRY